MVLSSAHGWLETNGTLLDKDRNLIRPPAIRCNKLQRQVCEIIEWCAANGVPCRIVGLKARQVGLSTISVAAAYHACRKRATKFLLIGDEYDKSVKNLVEDMFDQYAEHDQFDWGNSYHRPSGKFSNGSVIVTDTANDNRAGASGTFQFAIGTEVAHWKETKSLSAAKVFQAFMGCIADKPGTVVIIESTANGEGNAYHTIYQGAITFDDLKAGRKKEGWNGFIKVFMSWHEFPDYTSAVTPIEAAQIMATLDERERELIAMHPRTVDAGRIKWRREVIASAKFNGNTAKFEEEYPSDEDSAFLTTGGRAFSAPHIKAMMAKAMATDPEWMTLTWQDAGHGPRYPRPDIVRENEAFLKCWERPVIGLRYYIVVDPMTGRTTGQDPDNHGIHCYRAGYRDAGGRWHPRKLVARLTDCGGELAERLQHGKIKACCRWEIDIATDRVAMLSEWYGRCLIVPEINMDRGMTPKLLEMGYPIYVQRKYNQREQKDENYNGWDTTNENRGPIIAGLSRVIRHHDADQDGIEILDPVVIQEFRVFVRTTKGKEEAMGGWHDDNVLAAAIAEDVRDAGTVMRDAGVRPMGTISRLAEEQRRRSGGQNSTYA